MSRLLALSLLTSLIGLSSGCAMCCAPFDYDYLVTGGRWTRFNPTSGRVGSAFDEAGGPSDVVPVTATGEPTPARPTPTQSTPTPAVPSQPSYRSQTTMPRQQMRMVPGTRSVIPRDMGNTYLPNGE